MGKTILADSDLQSRIERIASRNIGIILGKVTPGKDYAVHLVRTPNPENDESAEEMYLTVPIETIDDVWMVTHALQVKRMMPGGVDVIGVFASGSPDELKNAQVKLRQVLYAMFKALNKRATYNPPACPSERLTMQICTLSKKLTCRTFDVTDPKCAAKPAEWKCQNTSERWQQLDSCLNLDLVLPISHHALRDTLEKQLLSHLEPQFDNIWNSLSLVGNKVLEDDELLVKSPSDSGKRGKKHKTDSGEVTAAQPLSVTLFQQVSPGSLEETQVKHCSAKVHIQGCVRGRAYAHSKATAGDAVKALKVDLIDSLTSRCELLCEDMLQSEEEQDPKVLYETPVRVFTELGTTGLCLCDYMFVDETAKDSCDRFRELVDLEVDEDNIHRDWESIPNEEDLVKPVRLPRELREGSDMRVGTPPLESSQPATNLTGLVLGGVMAALAAVVSYVYLGLE